MAKSGCHDLPHRIHFPFGRKGINVISYPNPKMSRKNADVVFTFLKLAVVMKSGAATSGNAVGDQIHTDIDTRQDYQI